MPQMAPYSWFYMNLMFSFLLIFYISYIYFTLPKSTIRPPYNLICFKSNFKMKW